MSRSSCRVSSVCVPQTIPWWRSVTRDLVVLVVVGEEKLVQRLRHVVDAARIGREEDLLLDVLPVRTLDLHAEVSLGNLHVPEQRRTRRRPSSRGGRRGVDSRFDDRGQEVVRRVDVVVDRVALVPRALHRVRRRALLGEVDDGVGTPVADEVEELVVVLGDVQPFEADLASGELAPRIQPRAERGDRGQRGCLELRCRRCAARSCRRSGPRGPRCDRCSDVGQPQKPSPPRIRTRTRTSLFRTQRKTAR